MHRNDLRTMLLPALLIAPLLAAAESSTLWPLVVRTEGAILVNNQLAPDRIGQTIVNENFVIATRDGRAEIKLREGGRLFLGPNAALRIIDNRPYDSTKLELIKGSIVLATGDSAGNTVTCENTMTLSDGGVFRIDANLEAPADSRSCRLRVRAGAAAVKLASKMLVLNPGKTIGLSLKCGDMIPRLKFDLEEMDDLDRWSSAPR